MTTVVCELCNKEEYQYKVFHTPDGKWLCNQCSMKLRELSKSATLSFSEYIDILERNQEIEELKDYYLSQLRLDVIHRFGEGKPTEQFIRQCVREYVDKERQDTETFIKKDRLTITQEDFYNMLLRLLGTMKLREEKDLGLIQAPKFLDFYMREVGRK